MCRAAAVESIRKRFRTYTNETTPILAYYDHQGLVHKIDGTRDVDAVWADTVTAVGAIEQQFGGAPASVCAHVYCDAGARGALGAAAVEQRLRDAAAARFGAGKIGVSARVLKVDASMKAYGLETAPAFD